MGFAEASAHLEALGIDAMKSMAPSLHRIEALLSVLDDPEKKIPAIHITGTNGKTSVARITTSLLVAAGLKVGTYTSPHLGSMTERIALNGEPISEEAFGEAFDHLAPYLSMIEERLGEKLTYFEVMTALFFLWATEAPVEAVVVEVGLGGLWDATNVLDAPVCVITNIGLDHTELLGDRASIAKEKSGIIKADSIVVTAERDPEMLAIITGAATDPGDVSVLSRDFEVIENKVALGGRYLSLSARGRNYDGLFLALHGAHQGVNAACALQAALSFLPSAHFEHSVIADGFAAVTSPGRLETVKTERPVPTVLDVAHNPDGISALVFSLSEAFAFERVVFVVGILRDKDYKGMIAELTRVPSAIVFTQPRFARSASVETLEAAADELGSPSATAPTVEEALALAYSEAGERDLVCVTGSHYVVGEARGHLLRS
jgi:dihydrofolate synthase/folylpolyglutamate synthase